MPVRYLSDPEFARLSSWPDEIADEDAVTYFTLSDADVSWLASFNRQQNRLGVAVQLSTLPWLGWIPDDLATCPSMALDRLAEALAIAPDTSSTLLTEYGGWQGETRRKHRGLVLDIQPDRPSINRPSSTRSANRNGHRPAAIVTNASGSTTSVQPTGSENCRASSSRKNTRSCDQFCRTERNTNSRPDHGWNGWVTRTIRSSPTGWSAVDDSGQRVVRDDDRPVQDRVRARRFPVSHRTDRHSHRPGEHHLRVGELVWICG
jgi:Domain of unknown function (DUF4158)